GWTRRYKPPPSDIFFGRAAGFVLRADAWESGMLVSVFKAGTDTNVYTNKDAGYQRREGNDDEVMQGGSDRESNGFRRTRNNSERTCGAPGRTRTSTMLPSPDFESGASTNSATGARPE